MIVVTDKAGRLKRIVFATCLQVALYCFYLGNANAQTGPAMPQVLSEQRVTPFMFKGAHHCFRYCSGRKVRFGEEHMAVRYNFVDFLSTSDWGQSAFVALLEELSPSFKAFGMLGKDDYPGLKMSGYVTYALTDTRGPMYVYFDVGYPAQAGERRPSGIMYAVVDPRAKEMALLFNGGDDLSNYRFAGPEELNSYLLSYKIANEVEVERAYLVGRQTMPEAPIFPIPDERLNDVLRRSYYLSSLYHNNAISSARSAYFAGNEKRKDIERPWYGIARGRQGCVETISPAQQIKIIRDAGVEPRIRETLDSKGDLITVSVSYVEGLYETTHAFYRERLGCEATLNNRPSIPEKYR